MPSLHGMASVFTGSVLPFISSSSSFLADAYDLFIIDVVRQCMASLYPQSKNDSANIATAALVGAILGQLFFGLIGDKIGRKWTFMVTLSLVVLGSLGSATCMDGQAVPIYVQLVIWRSLLGFGVGGEYPLAATLTSESAKASTRGRSVASVFAMQGVGKLMSGIMTSSVLSSNASLDTAWRICLAFGAVPGLLTGYFRWRMEESTHFKAVQAHDAAVPSYGATVDAKSSDSAGLLTETPRKMIPATTDSMKMLKLLWVYKWTLIGTAGCWFLIDVTFYGQGLFSATVLSVAGVGGDAATGILTRQQLKDVAIGSLILVSMAMPGYIFTVFTVDGRMGRWGIQLMGFAVSAVLFLILGAAYYDLTHKYQGLFVFLYGLTYFFSNWGANSTTFILPSEVFPTRIRSTAHGISAAMGKLGATLGSYGLPYLLTAWGTDSASKDRGLQAVMYVCTAVCALGVVWTLLFTRESRDTSLEEVDAEGELMMNDGAAAARLVPGRVFIMSAMTCFRSGGDKTSTTFVERVPVLGAA